MTQEVKFKVGDKVRLKSGGPIMTVRGFAEWSYQPVDVGHQTKVDVNWFPCGGDTRFDQDWVPTPSSYTFHQDQLELAE